MSERQEKKRWEKMKAGEYKPIFLFTEVVNRSKKARKGRSRLHSKPKKKKKMTIRMISTIQWSVFTIACPMLLCFAERWGR